MRPDPARWVLGSLLGLTIIGAGAGPPADEPPSDRMLQKHGLKRSGPLFVLQAESAVHAKADELRKQSQDLSRARAQQRATMSQKDYQDTIKEWTNAINVRRAQSNAAQQTMNRIPKRRGYPVYYQQYQMLSAYRNELQMEISEGTAILNQIKSTPFDPSGRLKADAEVRDRQTALQQGAQELRKLVDEVRAKYQEVEKDPQVKKWLEIPEGRAGVKPKLGPSHTFVLEEKLLERIERQSSGDDAFAPAQKASRKGRRATKVKRPAASGDAGSPF